MTTSTAPVCWDVGVGAFVVCGFAEAAAVLRGQGWSSDLRLSPLISEELKDIPLGNMLLTDPPEHTRLRRLVSPPFTPKAIEALRPRVAAIAEALLDGLEGIGPEIDVLADIGYPVTLAVITELLDVGVEGAEVFAEHTPALARGFEFDAGLNDLMAAVDASTELSLFLTPILAERRRSPGTDFISALLALTEDGEPALHLGEVMATCTLLLVAGHETTANLIGNSTLVLLRDPALRSLLAVDPERTVDELLRCHGPIKLTSRTATADHVLGGQHISAGQAVLVDIQAANRDPLRFPDPLRVDLTRDTGHLAFGAGPHFCLGAALARLEAAEVLTRLFMRVPQLNLVGNAIQWRESKALHALSGLPVRIEEGAPVTTLR